MYILNIVIIHTQVISNTIQPITQKLNTLGLHMSLPQ